MVENWRLRTGKMTQRQVRYRGEIDDSQQAAWRKTLEVFDKSEQRFTELSLFPEDRENPEFVYLRQRWQELYSRDHRSDCLQVVLAPVIAPEGLPLACEVMDGNTGRRRQCRVREAAQSRLSGVSAHARAGSGILALADRR